MIRRVVGLAALVALAACGGDDAPSADLDSLPPVESSADVVEPDAETSADAPTGGEEGERLPAVELVGLTSGETMQLSDIEGPAVINLWATWCAPCRAEIPDFEEVHRQRGDEIRFVGINVGEDPRRAAEFIDEVGATYEQFADLDGDVSTALRATAMPVTVVIDADGVITTRHLGPLDQDGLTTAITNTL